MSIHFAPQWVKPIKPSSASVTPTSDAPPRLAASNTAFPALAPSPTASSLMGAHAAGGGGGAAPLSYSRVTHTPVSPNPADGYFGGYAAANGEHPFRYTREQMLALWDEDKVRDRPIELVDIAEAGSVIVSKDIVKPVGRRELSDIEKKILATTIHPPAPIRRQLTHAATPSVDAGGAASSGIPSRRPIGPPANGKDGQANGRAGFGGFGRGEGGAFGGAKFGAGAVTSPGLPGATGGGFAGVGKRTTARTRTDSEDPARPSAASTWRPTRTPSGTFKGVLGFGAATTPTAEEPEPAADAWKDKTNGHAEEAKLFGNGGGPGWGSGQRKWRSAAAQQQDDKPLQDENAPAERREPAPEPVQEQPPVEDKEDLKAIQWFYRDPNGQEQGPFTGEQMHEWFSHSYFVDTLPLRRANETTFHTLANLKEATGTAVQPFLTPVRPRAPVVPPGLPAPVNALPTPVLPVAAFRDLSIAPQSPGYGFNTAPFPSAYNQFNQPFRQQWSQPITPRANGFGTIGSVGQPGASPYAPVYSPAAAIRAPGAEIFSPSVGVGMPQASPWNAQPAYPGWQQQQAPQQQFIPEPQAVAPSESQPIVPPVEPASQQLDEPSYFPPVEPEPEPASIEELSIVEAVAELTEDAASATVSPEADWEVIEQPELEPVAAAPAPEPKPPASVWGKPAAVAGNSTPSRKASVSQSVSEIPISPIAKASLPAKPKVETPSVIAPIQPKAVATPDKPSTKTAPWATAEKPLTPSGPSLREIQEAEARHAELRRVALAEARAATASPAPMSAVDDLPTSLAWGLPSSGASKADRKDKEDKVATPPAPAWGSADVGAKKTLKQIQEEEEKRSQLERAKAAAALAAVAPAGASGVSTPKRGYADSAGSAAVTGAAAGWSTVGAGGKTASPAPAAAAARTPVPAPRPAASVVAAPKPAAPVSAASKLKADEALAPSVEFIRWTKQALVGLSVSVDDFIQMLLQFPVDPPAASRNDIAEIISDSVYASSATLDGRRFAHEFMARRKADASRNAQAAASGRQPAKVASLADVVKTQPKVQSPDLGFKVVKGKKGKKA
ncbi:kinesin-like protein [Cryptotrichosporon argae]